MSFKQKLISGLGLLVLLLPLLGGILLPNLSPKAHADSQQKLNWDSCVAGIEKYNGSNTSGCNFFGSAQGSCGAQLEYGLTEPQVQLVYEVPYSKAGYDNSFPTSITVLDPNTLKPVAPSGTAQLSSDASFRPNSGGGDNTTSDGFKYSEYFSTKDSKWHILIARHSTTGALDILALVRDSSKPGTDPACAYNAQQPVYMATSTGGFCGPSSTDSACQTLNQATLSATTATASAATPDCWTSGSLGLEWLFCPVLKAIDAVVYHFNNFINDQLHFSSGDKTIQAEGTQRIWSTFRVLATALLIIIMLIAIISQAIGSGPFDAYTIRKILPKLVIAVILIQLSWVLFGWLINFINDIGDGLRSLMTAPFGGENNMTLAKLMNGANTQDSDIFLTAAAVGAGIGVAFLTAAGVLALAVPVILAVIIGFITLIARKIVIILCLVLSPIALVAWILPGTNQYFMTWWKAFSRALLMYPLIVSLIYIGRIFAFVASGTPTSAFHSNLAQMSILGHHLILPPPILAFWSGLAAFMLILVGYFGPYAILPKTFQWGGAAMGAIGGAMAKIHQRTSQPTKGYLDEQAKFKRQFRSDERAKRLSEGESRYPRMDKLLGGGYNIFRGRGGMRRGFESTLAGGRKSAEEAAAAALVGSRFEALNHSSSDPTEMTKIEAAKIIAAGGDVPEIGLSGKDPTLRLHMLDQLATWGDWDKITDLRQNQQIPERLWQRFSAKNISAIHQQAPHLSPLGSKADLSQSGYQEYATWKDEAFKQLHRQLLAGEVPETKDPADMGKLVQIDPTRRADQIVKGLGNIQGFLDDRLMEGRISTENRADLERTKAEIPVDLSNTDLRAKLSEHISIGMATPAGTKERKLAGNLVSALASRVAEAPIGSAEEASFRGYIDQLAAAAPTSPQAKAIHNALVQAVHGRLEQNVKDAERDAVAAGHDAAGVDAVVTAAVGHGTQKITSMDSMGTGTPMAPIP